MSESRPVSRPTAAGANPWAEEQRDIEETWVEAARHDPRAFAPLYDRYAVAIYRFCYRKVGDPDIANDLTPQIFMRAIERIDRYRPRLHLLRPQHG